MPPIIPETASKGLIDFAQVRYDSVSGTTGGSKVYIVYEKGRAYPNYLITYDQV
jgi:hypothetical protein